MLIVWIAFLVVEYCLVFRRNKANALRNFIHGKCVCIIRISYKCCFEKKNESKQFMIFPCNILLLYWTQLSIDIQLVYSGNSDSLGEKASLLPSDHAWHFSCCFYLVLLSPNLLLFCILKQYKNCSRIQEKN